MPRGLELLIAQTILQGFDAQYGRFLEVTSGAAAFRTSRLARCPAGDEKPYPSLRSSRGSGRGATALHYQRPKHGRGIFTARQRALHPAVAGLPALRDCGELFNSVYCRLFDHRSLTPERLFIFSSQPERRFRTIPRPLAKDFHPDHGWESLLMRVISDLPLRLRWQNKSRDIHYIVRHLTETLGTDNLAESHLQVANELFYRNKAAGWWAN